MTPFDKISSYLTPLNSTRFYEMATDYGIDASFALATFAWETGYGSSELWNSCNNPAGITCGEEYCSYDSQEQGLHAMFNLMSYYIRELNRCTVASVRELWSETEDAQQIVEIMEEIQNGLNKSSE
ncbi:glucosaminidase domain-containing protein [Dielma fastidiosa]|uniref:glucosaminidase domain-containing protein n=1 Tax=Dielma fastidiosa TaxID=1034346 RepID=UPI000E50AC50|nr:glucosaminidase domain-containing protein [Dielma fastidiosa]RHN01507.1 hypothetical protein DWZ33_05805 [Dielma fastidiosa]